METEAITEEQQVSIRPDFMQEKYTEYNPLNLKAYEDGHEITLMTYRYAVPHGVQKKGIVLMLTGYGGYCEHSAYFLKKYAESGYECFALDLRGFGNSEGTRGFLNSSATLYNDIELFIHGVIAQYHIDPKRTPIFLHGTSFGGLQAHNISLRNPEIIKGMTLVVPFFAGKKNLLKNFFWAFHAVNFINPKVSIPLIKVDEEFTRRFPFIAKDEKFVKFGMVSTLCMFQEMQEYAQENASKSKVPYLLILAENESVVSNEASQERQKAANNPLNKEFVVPGKDHFDIGEEWQLVVKKSIEYFDELIKQQ